MPRIPDNVAFCNGNEELLDAKQYVLDALRDWDPDGEECKDKILLLQEKATIDHVRFSLGRCRKGLKHVILAEVSALIRRVPRDPIGTICVAIPQEVYDDLTAHLRQRVIDAVFSKKKWEMEESILEANKQYAFFAIARIERRIRRLENLYRHFLESLEEDKKP